MTIETYPEMNAKIVDILQRDKDNPLLFYAAQRIEELEAEIERLQRELHDEQVRRNKWERMCEELGLVALEPAPDAPPCGHPPEAATGDVTHCALCESENHWRVGATIDRLISNIPAACIALREQGHATLARQLQWDRENLRRWQERGGLREVA